MNQPPRPIRIATLAWTFGIGALVLALGVGVLLPSTKRARLHFQLPSDERQTPGDAQPQARATRSTGDATKPAVDRP